MFFRQVDFNLDENGLMSWQIGLIEICYVVEMSLSSNFIAMRFMDMPEDVQFWLNFMHSL